ncbi:cytochrome P450 26A1-like [Mizuhopecten yessoensis]|uniref:Cytochrome P450 26A1 n=1 Tax=Mizuhopecten yessoensis TaxID=6573 RepID=A0A210R299_MIZYE|nr:cytochrome P450 26A1-like [Mizuhopecten yessoensis]XP_021375599.1 cytochrome P450 26A1-like [Mizuhopecten yessoensis]XP_021375607.1 cytochrome P450 26A1-like [Mizuhopecten yessoensis]XP_021375615.1 cytochrome P450 26A1-like [Mizuhopecten yessoensis]XP_021375625.1 cytochrome P450 26A1-like [Mizuhopecten yessoensis]XP_021375631.1 cytochrome P450 26A1-like [Mizuhopecten yessoensis]OWF55062.1 Cytochrome P450 26A1 [Mizuhopecten yessoensis]
MEMSAQYLFADCSSVWSIAVGILAVLLILPTLLKWGWHFYINRVYPADTASSKPLPPGTLGYPIIGETIQFILKIAEYYHERRTKYGAIYKTHLMGRPTIRVSQAEYMKIIVNGENTIVISQWPEATRRILGNGALSMMSGETHKLRKKFVAAAFSQTALQSYIPSFQTICRQGLTEWRERRHIIAFDECKTLAFKIASKVLVGFQYEKSSELVDLFEVMMYNTFSLPINLPGFGLYKGLKAKEKVVAEIDKCLMRIETEGSDQDFTTAMHFILYSQEGGATIPRKELCEAANELLFTGHDTTSSTLCSVLMYLGKNPEYLHRLRAELKANDLLDYDDDTVDLNLMKLNSLPFLHNVMKETLRLAPPVGAGFRRAIKTFEVGDYQVPEGWTVSFGIRETHHNSPVFTKGLEFNPDRWTEELSDLGKQETGKFNFLPFGYGSRICVGKEYAKLLTKVFIVELCRSCDWELMNDDIKMSYIPVAKPKDSLPLCIYNRGDN